MDNKILRMEDFKKDHFYKMNYLDLEFWEVLQCALLNFDIKPFDVDGGRAPDTWNPILFCASIGQFDPNMMDGSRARYLEGIPWTAWPKINGYKRTIQFIDEWYDLITSPKWYKKIPISVPRAGYTGKRTIMETHFLYTKETLSDNKVVITICNMATRKYKRIYITDLKMVIRDMFIRNKHNNLEYKKLKTFNIPKLKNIVLDGSQIEIQDKSIYEILLKLDFINSKIYTFTSA